ncbi:MAG: GNAT family acetyltransferase [Gammaproteobacteria bacterium]|nr:GNAT family acetyltransferase [Gammaproteobacteria bacterium]
MFIRSFQVDDTDAVIDLWERCDLVVPWNDPHKDIERKLKVGAELFLVGELDGAIVASAMGGYEGHRGWVNYLAVSPNHRQKGFGQDIMATLEQLLLNLGCPKINLQIRSTNANVIAFYNSIGYQDDNVLSLGKRLIPDDT